MSQCSICKAPAVDTRPHGLNGVCFPCASAAEEARIKPVNNTESPKWTYDDPECPWCGYCDEDYHGGFDGRDFTNCKSCRKPILIEGQTCTLLRTWKGEDHD